MKNYDKTKGVASLENTLSPNLLYIEIYYSIDNC